MSDEIPCGCGCSVCAFLRHKAARNANLRRGLPELRGNWKLVQAAECIRAERFEEIERLAVCAGIRGDETWLTEILQRAKLLKLRADARFWIARREMSIEGLLELVAAAT